MIVEVEKFGPQLMDSEQLQKIIAVRLEGLALEALQEIADFVLFIRLRAIHPETFKDAELLERINHELNLLDQQEQSHLESEFSDYDDHFPE